MTNPLSGGGFYKREGEIRWYEKMRRSEEDRRIRSSVANLKKKANWWFITLVIGLLAGFLFLVYQANHLRKQIVTLSEENQALSQLHQVLTQRNEKLSYFYDLATEFSLDPAVVNLVDHYARDYMSHDGPEWRLVRTPEFMTYIMLSLIYVESKGDPSAVGDGGKARGLTQIWVSTAREYGDVTPEELHQPETVGWHQPLAINLYKRRLLKTAHLRFQPRLLAQSPLSSQHVNFRLHLGRSQ